MKRKKKNQEQEQGQAEGYGATAILQTGRRTRKVCDPQKKVLGPDVAQQVLRRVAQQELEDPLLAPLVPQQELG